MCGVWSGEDKKDKEIKMKSEYIPKDIEIYILKSKDLSIGIKTIIIKYKKEKIWFNISWETDIKIIELDRLIIGKGLLINLINKGIENIKLGYKKVIILEKGRPSINKVLELGLEYEEIKIGRRNIKIPKDMSITLKGNRLECWGKNKTEMNIFLESLKKLD